MVRKLEQYAEPVTAHGFISPGEAHDWILADQAKRRPSRRKLWNYQSDPLPVLTSEQSMNYVP